MLDSWINKIINKILLWIELQKLYGFSNNYHPKLTNLKKWVDHAEKAYNHIKDNKESYLEKFTKEYVEERTQERYEYYGELVDEFNTLLIKLKVTRWRIDDLNGRDI